MRKDESGGLAVRRPPVLEECEIGSGYLRLR
jgi:hypothetical protein